jgi:DNA-3-methyladenine glycosylase I
MNKNENNPFRCPWCIKEPIYIRYHDEVWGVPEYNSHALFAKLILDGAQAGLSWITVLKREQGYFDAFDGLDPEIMAKYDEQKIEEILLDPGIIRNKAKVRSAVNNAKAYMEMKESGVSFSDFLWDFVDGKPIVNNFQELSRIPASTPLSITISKALQKKGFTFVGPTIIYAFMQAVGMVNDHLHDCFRYNELDT